MLVVVLLVALLGYQAWRARQDLLAARTEAHLLRNQLQTGQVGSASHTVIALQQSTARAHASTGSWLWGLAAHLPLVGDDVAAVRTATNGLDTIAQRALPTLIALAGDVDTGALRVRDGRLPLATIAQWAPQVQRAAEVVDGPASDLDRIDPRHLAASVGGPLRELRRQVDAARGALDTIARSLRVLPAAGGGSGPRTYLLLFQNNAEVRATGGMTGSWAVLHANGGRLTMGAQGTAGDLDAHPPAVAPVPATAAEKALYGTDLGTQLRDANANPNFPRFAAMASGLVGRYAHVRFDGVLAVDPVALSYLLRGTGPVRLDPTTTLTSSNAVRVLLHDVYVERTPSEQDALFAAAARTVFAAITAGHGNPLTLLRALEQGVEERRVLVWSQRSDLATAIAHTQVAGALTDPGTGPQLGVFLDDATATKLEYYLDTRTTVRPAACTPRSRSIAVRTLLRSTVPKTTPLPVSVTGPGLYAPRKVMTINVRIVAPRGGVIDGLRQDGHEVTIAGGVIDGRQQAVVPVRLAPGQVVDLRVSVRFPRSRPDTLQLTTTPSLRSQRDPVQVPTLCG